MLNKFGLEPTKAGAISIGDRFGRLTVVAVGVGKEVRRYYAVCECDCGSDAKRIRIDGLKSGAVVSCGCVHTQVTTKHGGTKNGHGTRWRNMMARCYDKRSYSYTNYGARGISVCERWHDVVSFVADVKAGYAKGLQLDRIDNDGDYTPENTKWSTRKENCNNRRSSVIVEYKGALDTVSNHARVEGLKPRMVMERIRDGWAVGDALSKPVADKHENILKAQSQRWAGHTKQPKQFKTERILRVVTYQGKEYTIRQLSNLCGVGHRLLAKRIFERGWLVDRAAETSVG